MRSSSSPSTSVSPARCSKRLRLSVPEASITAPGSTAVTRPIGTKIRRRATTSTTRPSTRGAAVPTRRATTTSRTLPTRSPLGSKTVSPASRETYALLAVVTGAEATVGAVAARDVLDYEIVDVFAPRAFAGNPLAVVFDADGLTTEQCQALAFEFHLSETSFVCAPTEPGADYRVRIFTPFAELPFAGHPSVGAAHTLVRTGRLAAGHAAPGVRRRRPGPGGRRRRRAADRRPADARGRPGPGRAGRARSGSSPADVTGRARARRRLRAALRLPRRAAATPSTAPCPTTPRCDALGVGEGVSVLSWDAADVDRLRPRVRRRPALGRGPGHRVGGARHRRLAGRRPACCRATGRRPTSSARARSWAGPSVLSCTVTAAGGHGRRRRPCAAPSCPVASGRIRVPGVSGPASGRRRPGRCTARARRDVGLLLARRRRRLAVRRR